MKTVAAIITEYRKNSHADVIVGKILEGYDQKGGKGPDLKLASMYIDQYPEKDMAKDMAKKHKVPIFETIEQAVFVGGKTVGVDGVLLIGEHGKYPFNDKGQHLYPRRRFFTEAAAALAKAKKIVPMFNDKHLAATWEDAKWMVDRARELFIPFMAGSSLPVTWRKPSLVLPRGCEIESALGIGYGGTESYGSHMLETLQCMVERRKGDETGVSSVQYFNNETMFKAMDDGLWSKELLEAAIDMIPLKAKGDYRKLIAANKGAGVLVIEYKDGLRAAAAMVNGLAHEGYSGAFGFIARLKGEKKPVGCHFYLQNVVPFGHFGYLLRAIQSMIETGHPAYPVERTLLTTGMLDAMMTSQFEKGKKLATPHLAIKYTPTNWPPAPEPAPGPEK